MHINILQIIVILIIAGLAWYANQQLNPVPVLKNVVNVLIVVVSVLVLLDATGIMSSNTSMVIK